MEINPITNTEWRFMKKRIEKRRTRGRCKFPIVLKMEGDSVPFAAGKCGIIELFTCSIFDLRHATQHDMPVETDHLTRLNTQSKNKWLLQ